MATLFPFATLSIKEPVFADKTRTPVFADNSRSFIAALRVATGYFIDEYFAGDYTVNNHDYVYTQVPQ